MKRYLHPVGPALAGLALGLTLLAPGAARAAAPTSYKIQPIARFGDKVGDYEIKTSGGDFEIGNLNDNGQLVFVADNKAGGEILAQYADGKLTPIVAGGLDGPHGAWPAKVTIASMVRMDQRGNVVFTAGHVVGGWNDGIYLWDYAAGKSTAMLLNGMPATGNLTFGQFGDPPVLNNPGDIAFDALVKNAAGKEHFGVFFRGRDGQVQSVALPDQELPGGEKVVDGYAATINDASVVAFLAATKSTGPNSAYLWDKGTITTVAQPGTEVPGLGKITDVWGALVNNQNHNVLLVIQLKSTSAPASLFRWADGQLTPLAVKDQVLPDGSKFRDLVFRVSDANEAGQHVLIAQINDSGHTTRAAYLLDADGKLSLILKTGATTDLGKITQVALPDNSPPSVGISINNKGQVALPVRIEASTAATLVLLTPVTP